MATAKLLSLQKQVVRLMKEFYSLWSKKNVDAAALHHPIKCFFDIFCTECFLVYYHIFILQQLSIKDA